MKDMKLNDFVAQTLTEIIAGVGQAQRMVREHGGNINPVLMNSAAGKLWDHDTKTHIQEVEFDIAVTVTEGKGTEGGIGVVAGIIALGSRGRSDKSDISLSRIKFSVPVTLPPGRSRKQKKPG